MALSTIVKYFVCSNFEKSSKEEDGVMAMVLWNQKSPGNDSGKSIKSNKKSDSFKILKLGEEALNFLRMAI